MRTLHPRKLQRFRRLTECQLLRFACGSVSSYHSALQKELAKIREEDERIIEDLQERMADSERKARSAEEYLGKREVLMNELARLKVALAEQKAAGERTVAELERKHVQDRCYNAGFLRFFIPSVCLRGGNNPVRCLLCSAQLLHAEQRVSEARPTS